MRSGPLLVSTKLLLDNGRNWARVQYASHLQSLEARRSTSPGGTTQNQNHKQKKNTANEDHICETNASHVSEFERSTTLQNASSPIEIQDDYTNRNEDHDSDIECMKWISGVNHTVPSDWDSDGSDFEGNCDDDEESDEELSELEGEELIESLRFQAEQELEILKKLTLYERVQRKIGRKEWEKAESNRALGYNGNSSRTKRRREKATREKSVEVENNKSRDI